MFDILTLANVLVAFFATILEVIYCVALFSNKLYLVSNVRRQFQCNVPLTIFLVIGSLIRGLSNLGLYNLSPFLFKCTFYCNVFGLSMLLFGTAALIIERLVATILWKRYSNMNISGVVTFILGTTAIGLSITAAILYDKDRILRGVIALWVLHLFFSSLTALLILRNRSLRRVSRSIARLSYSYQLVENLRVLAIVMPYLCVITLLASIAPISLVVCPMLGVSLRDSIEVFYLIYNTVLLLCLIMAVRRNYLHKWKRRPKVSSIRAVFEIRGPLGTKMPAKDTIDDHFRALQSSWEGMATGTKKA